MRKKLSKILVSVLTTAMVITSLPVDMLSVRAEEATISVSGNDAVVTEEVELPVYQEISESELSGTFGPSSGFSWTYDESTETLTITGEDSSYQTLDSYLPGDIKTAMRHIVFRDFTISGNLSYFLSDFGELESVVFENVDTSNVTDMESMFYLCRKLKTLDLSSFDTGNVTDMGSMFGGCSALESLDLSNFDTSNVTDMSYMFDVCSGLTSLDVSSFDTGNVKLMNSMFDVCTNVESLDVSGFDTTNVTNMEKMFASCKGLQALDLSGFDTTNVTNMSGMLTGCSSLTTITTPKTMGEGQSIVLPYYFYNPENVETSTITPAFCNQVLLKDKLAPLAGNFGDNNGFRWSYDDETATLIVTGEDSGLNALISQFPESVMENMQNIIFRDCAASGSLEGLLLNLYNIKSLTFENFDTGNVSSMKKMFEGCHSLTSVNISGFDTGNVTDMSSMFYDCIRLQSVDLGGLDISNVTDMSSIFYNCGNLESVDLSDLDTGNVTNMSSMFYGCSKLKSLDVSGFATGNVTDMSNMFYGCSSVKELDVTNFATGNVTTLAGMFYNCCSLKTIDLSSFDTRNVTDLSGIFYNCNKLTTITTPKFMAEGQIIELPYVFYDPKNDVVTNITGVCCNQILTKDKLTGTFGTNGGFNWSYDDINEVLTITGQDSGLPGVKNCVPDTAKKIIFEECIISGGMGYLLQGKTQIESVEFIDCETKEDEVTSFNSMFDGCSNLKHVDISGLDSSNIVYMQAVFSGCTSLESVDLSSWDTGNVEYMSSMFRDCSSLKSLDLSGFNTAKVTKMDEMFSGCGSLKSVDVSSFNTGKVTTMQSMFANCTGLESVDVSGFDTSKVTDMSYMFNSSTGLKSVDVSGFATGNVTNMRGMFSNCPGLESVDFSSFDISKVTDLGYMFYNGRSLKTIVTPKVMTAEQSIELPHVFYDSQGQSIELITSEHCNKLLVKDNVDYTITYHLDGGTNAVENPASYTTFSDTIILKEPTWEGFVFEGWYTDNTYSSKQTQISAHSWGNVELYAKWLPHKYTVKFDGNGGEGSMEDFADLNYGTSYTLPSNTYERAGYTFAGWNTAADGSGETFADNVRVENLTSADGATVTLYAQWTINKYSVVFDKNAAEAEGEMADITNVEIGETVILPVNAYEYSGYTFAGWNTAADGNGESYADNARVENLTDENGATVILYAQWVVNKYSVVFDKNATDATGEMANLVVNYDTEVTLTANVYERPGYTFAGWNTMADGSGEMYADTARVKNLATENGATVTLYAQWTINKYSVVFDKNAAEASGEMADITNVEIGERVILPTNVYEYSGYTFAGWNTAADGNGESYADNASVENLTDENGATVILYAQWVVNKYSVVFDKNATDATGEMADLVVNYDTEVTLTANVYERPGYTFAGWNTMADGNGEMYADTAREKNLTTENGATVTLYAQWIVNKYTVVFDKNAVNASGEMANLINIEYGETVTLPVNAYTYTGCTFAGWNTVADGSGVSYANNASVEKLTAENGATVTLYAQWIVNKYTVVFDKNAVNASGEMANLTNIEYGETVTLPVNAYTYTGCTFAGWNTAADGSGEFYADTASVESLTSEDGATVSLYAQWTVNKYTIKFDKNGATGGIMSDMTNCVYGADYKLTANKFSRTGYTFKGWALNKKGTGTLYKNTAAVKNLTAINGQTITLYAQWTANKYTIRFKKNGSKVKGTMKSMTNREYGKSYKLTKNTFKRKGYTFKGWTLNKKGTGKVYKNRASIKNLTKVNGKTITLYAKWKANKYTIKFNKNAKDATGKMKSMTNRKYGKTYKLTKNAFERKGYTFKGWNTKKNGKGKSYKNGAKVKNLVAKNKGTITLYAQWKEKK